MVKSCVTTRLLSRKIYFKTYEVEDLHLTIENYLNNRRDIYTLHLIGH